ncbi:hypothetical protein BDZ85DRAFT_258385 [Elsinoe ampelina]|uniref:Uncharacterized protein n=1 Tax=Elsinoe ampelina TaxID=302913 RepID=A0A6A6GJW0_9PEZI|nr:hypothetical protein BDZ85DRAFT_258385 [Elsinoe ampelina]
MNHLTTATDLTKSQAATMNMDSHRSSRTRTNAVSQDHLDRSDELEDISGLLTEPPIPYADSPDLTTFTIVSNNMKEDPDPAPVAEKQPDNYDYTTTTAEDGFEAVHADPRPLHDLSGSYADIDNISEGGQTADSVSACDQSDAETVESIADDEDAISSHEQGSQLLFPDPARLPAAAAREVAAGAVMPKALRQEEKVDDSDVEGHGVDQSEITIRGSDDSKDTLKKEAVDPKPNFAEKYLGVLNRSLKSAEDFFSANFRSSILPAAMTMIAVGVLAFLMAPLSISSMSAGSPFWSGPHLPANEEMILRHHQLQSALKQANLTSWNGSAIEPSKILSYPQVWVLGDSGHSGFKEYTFQTGIRVEVNGPGQIFISLPKDKRTGKYLQKPEIQVRHVTEHLEIAEQKDLIRGLTFVRLDAPYQRSYYAVKVKAGHIDDRVVAYGEEPKRIAPRPAVQASTSPGSESKPKNNSIRSSIDTLLQGFRQLSDEVVASSAHQTHEVQRSLAEYKERFAKQLQHEQTQVRSFISSICQTVTSTFSLKHVDVAKEFSAVKEDLSSAANIADNVSQKLSSSISGVFDQVVLLTAPVIQTTVNGSHTILARAQRNGQGILRRLSGSFLACTSVKAKADLVKRMKAILTPLGISVTEEDTFHDIKNCQQTCKRKSHSSCKKSGRRTGKHGH